ncbi:MAG: hypothetical protein OEZ13_00155 [Spirochaetia bacterium]|nr:hypothetical protein [Spirochaetia bacterium]
MKKQFLTVLAAMLTIFFITVSCANDVGETCESLGSSDECVDEGVCGDYDGILQCLQVCTADADCSSTEACNGVSGTNIKGCQPK